MGNSQSELEREISIEGSPYFIEERDKGQFYVVSSVLLKIIEKTNEKLGEFRDLFTKKEFSWLYTLTLDINEELREGLDIREYPNRGIQILIEEGDDHPIPKLINTLRDFAYISGYDYFSIQGNVIDIGDDGFKVTPRIFRKIVDN